MEGREAPSITVRVYRPETGGRRARIFQSPLDEMLQGDASYPSLRDDDIIVVETVRSKQPFGWRDVLSIVSTLASLTLLGLRILTRV